MLDAFLRSFNILDIPYDDLKKIVEELYLVGTFEKNEEHKKVNFADIVSLYNEYLETNKKSYVSKMLNKYKDEIIKYIDLYNTREILNFFRDKGILEKFRTTSLVKITVFSTLETVKKVYQKIIDKHSTILEMYFEDSSAPLWVDDDGKKNKTGKIIIRGIPEEKKDKKSLYSQSHNQVSLEQFWRNCDLLEQYSDLFIEKYDLSNLGAHLKVKTSSEFEGVIRSFSKLVRGELPSFHRNLSICRLFGLGQVYKLPVSLFETGSIETKIHLAIELGLLNPPMTDEYIQIEKEIAKIEDFQMNIRKKGYDDQSIRNYFLRYLSSLACTSVNDYGMLHYKLLTMGRGNFYQEFFSKMITGQSNPQFIKEEDEETLTEKVKEYFEYDSYSELISGYTEYSDAIEEYDRNPYNDDFDSQPYFDEKILSDPLIEELELNHCVNDKILQGEQLVSVKNNYVYMFGDRIISRYKVLHNVSILKQKYGYIDENMLLSSIVKKSFIDSGTFNKIKKEIIGRRKSV